MNVVVLGAGVMGAATAFELARHGAEVVLVEPLAPGGGTSSRGAGLVCEGLWHPASLRLASRSIEILQAVSRSGDEEGHPFRFHPTGSTTLLSADQVPGARALAAMQAREGVPVREVVGEDIRGLPRHAGMRVDDVALALHYPRDGWALPRMYAEVCSIGARMMGAMHVRGEARIVREPLSVEVEGERHRADAIVVACGVWTPRVLATADLRAPILAYRTQALRFSDTRAEGVPILHDAVQGFYLRPGIPQQLIAGDGTTTRPEDVGAWRAEGDDDFVAHTRRRLRHRFPFLAPDAAVDAWAGIEAATPDRLLLAGRHPGARDVWLLAGGNGHGFMRAPAAAEALAAMVRGKAPRIDMAAFDPARFAGHDGRFPIREGYSLEHPVLK
ncbi:MAG TPA: FAD-dependent oxidoreductase [Candidatus Thermoplasmatota archaeon]|nr:FAD-dependent oxidoreductase [Candidatus Thermoplasmatota archaeon]